MSQFFISAKSAWPIRLPAVPNPPQPQQEMNIVSIVSICYKIIPAVQRSVMNGYWLGTAADVP